MIHDEIWWGRVPGVIDAYDHINAYLMWKELAPRLCLGKTIDSELQRAC